MATISRQYKKRLLEERDKIEGMLVATRKEKLSDLDVATLQGHWNGLQQAINILPF